MAFDTIYKALRDYVGSKVVSALAVDWFIDPQEVPATNYALLSLASSPNRSGAQRIATYAVNEDWLFTFGIAAKFARPALPTSIDDFLIGKASGLRAALYADNHLGGNGFLPNVESVDMVPHDEADDFVELLVIFSCMSNIDR